MRRSLQDIEIRYGLSVGVKKLLLSLPRHLEQLFNVVDLCGSVQRSRPLVRLLQITEKHVNTNIRKC